MPARDQQFCEYTRPRASSDVTGFFFPDIIVPSCGGEAVVVQLRGTPIIPGFRGCVKQSFDYAEPLSENVPAEGCEPVPIYARTLRMLIEGFTNERADVDGEASTHMLRSLAQLLGHLRGGLSVVGEEETEHPVR